MPPLLRHLDLQELTSAAGGNPWQLDDTIQAGAPGEINELATAFHEAGSCLTDADDEFNTAKERFEEAWDRDDGGGHPINDSAEVQRATTSLHLDKEELARVAIDLANISASLAETQQTSAQSIQTLDASLRQIDSAIDAAIAQTGSLFDQNALAPLKNMAIQQIANALEAIGAARDTYSGELSNAMDSMRAEGYLPDAVDAADGDGVNAQDSARGEAADYNFQQLAADQALVNSAGPMTPEKIAAAARLRDYATIQDPMADPTAVRLAGERLDDFQTARRIPGTLPVDPILGSDPQRRALVRQEWQKQLEAGSSWMPPMSPDQATAWMDRQESVARSETLREAVRGLESQGLSKESATSVATAMSQGASLKDIASAAGPLGELKQADGLFSDNRHVLPWERMSTSEIKTIAGLGKGLTVAGPVLEFVAAYQDVQNGAAPGKTWGEAIGTVGGGYAGGALVGMAGGALLGPPGMFVGAVVGGLAFGEGGKQLGGYYGSKFDN
ncbi:putative alpha/beta hydrolase [Mycobacterium sp. NPDC003449]